MTDTKVAAGQLVTAAKGNELIVAPTAPASPATGQLWQDTSVAPANLWVYTGTVWRKVFKPQTYRVGSATPSWKLTNSITSVYKYADRGGAVITCDQDILVRLMHWVDPTGGDIYLYTNFTGVNGAGATVTVSVGQLFSYPTVAYNQIEVYELILPGYKLASPTENRYIATNSLGYQTAVTFQSISNIEIQARTAIASTNATLCSVDIYKGWGGR